MATIRELEPWDGSAVLLIDGGDGVAQRSPLHLQAGPERMLRLHGPSGPLMWGLLDDDWYGINFVRAKEAAIHALPPVRVDEAEQAPDLAGSQAFCDWWTRHFARLLCESTSTPIAARRRYLFGRLELLSTATDTMSAGRVAIEPRLLGELREQQQEFYYLWDFGEIMLLTMRPLSDEDDGRVKMWRKHARERRLPPIVTWWCSGLFAHVILDGHDRLQAALLENATPDFVVLAHASPVGSVEVAERRESAETKAGYLERIPVLTHRASAMNAWLQSAWDPRAEWDLVTPGFPLDGGAAQWEAEIRGTCLERWLAEQRQWAAERGPLYVPAPR